MKMKFSVVVRVIASVVITQAEKVWSHGGMTKRRFCDDAADIADGGLMGGENLWQSGGV
jgi:hypothetical protein